MAQPVRNSRPPDAGLHVRENVPLAGVTTFRLGGPCRRLITCTTPESLVQAVRSCLDDHVTHLLIGGGSNLVVSDQGFDGTVLRFTREAPEVEVAGNDWMVTGSTQLDDFARLSAEAGCEGVTCCHGIPGTVGGAIVGNAGAWGRQVSDALVSVTVLDPDGAMREIERADLGFGYRRSVLQQTGQVVLRARFSLLPASSASLMNQREQILRQRRGKHPDPERDPCIGSIFRNIEPTSDAGKRQAAGWFLERAGAKDMKVGGARVYPGHANIVVKGPGCTAQDVRDLACRMKEAVRKEFGLVLQREVRFLGPFKGEEDQPRDRFF
jgi:UDP-N-acetylmuramate dehydrogenase